MSGSIGKLFNILNSARERNTQKKRDEERIVSEHLDRFSEALRNVGGPTTTAGLALIQEAAAKDPLIASYLPKNVSDPNSFMNPEQRTRMDDLAAEATFRRKNETRTEKTVWPAQDKQVAHAFVDEDIEDQRKTTEFNQKQADHAEDRTYIAGTRTAQKKITDNELANMPVNDILKTYRELGGDQTEAGRIFLRNASFKNESLASLRLLRPDALKTDASRRQDQVLAMKPQPEPELDRTKKITDVLANIAKVREANIDPATGKSKNPRLDAGLSLLEEQSIGGDPNSTPAPDRGYTLADQIAGYSQGTKRTWLDDTVSPADLITGIKNYAARLESDGVPKNKARKLATSEYLKMSADDAGTFQTIPKLDATKIFTDLDTRDAAPTKGETIVDTGDGKSTVPQPMAASGMSDSQQVEFSDLKKVVSNSLPKDFNLENDLKRRPDFYKKLLAAIKAGRTGKDGKKETMSREQMLQFILANRGG